MSGEIYIFAGGGTGGHLYPALAVAGELIARRGGARIVFACSNRAIDRRILGPLPHAIVPQPVRPFPSRPLGWLGFAAAYATSALLARRMVLDLRPAAVLGLGGFAAGPVVSRASAAGVPVGLLNPDAVPGKANRLLARRADVIFTQFASTAETFPPKLRGRVRCVGCPVRAGLAGGEKAEAVAHFGLRADRRTLLVFGGSLLAESLSLAVAELADDLADLAEQWQLLHVTGSPRAEQMHSDLAGRGVSVVTLGYCDRMDLAYAAADVALARAGAVTVAELAATGTPAVLMPYPYHADQHQRLNAAALVEAGAAVICDDVKAPAANADNLRRTLLPLLRDTAALDKMRATAANLAPNQPAAAAVAEWLAAAGA